MFGNNCLQSVQWDGLSATLKSVKETKQEAEPMKKNPNRFYDFIASLMFLFDVNWDEELPGILGEPPEIRVVKGGRKSSNLSAS